MVNLYLLYMRRCTLCMGLHSSAFFIDIENMILPPSSSLWALIPCRHTQINTHAYTNGWRKVWWKKHNIFLSLPGSWVIFILNARKLVSLSFYAPLSGFYLPFTSRALSLPLLLCSFIHPFIRAVWEWSCQWGDERLQSGVFITDTHKHIGCPTSAACMRTEMNACV